MSTYYDINKQCFVTPIPKHQTEKRELPVDNLVRRRRKARAIFEKIKKNSLELNKLGYYLTDIHSTIHCVDMSKQPDDNGFSIGSLKA